MKTRILARTYMEKGEWKAMAYQRFAVFCSTHGPSQEFALRQLKELVEDTVATQATSWISQWMQSGNDVVNCPEGAVKLPIDMWVCKLTKQNCPIQAQVFLNERELFIQHCQASDDRKTQIFESVANGLYEGFHHLPGRYLCVSCEHEKKPLNFQHHYPWELTSLSAYFPFVYEQDWPAVRQRLKDKRHSLVSCALCASHCKDLAEQVDPALAKELLIIEFEIDRRGALVTKKTRELS